MERRELLAVSGSLLLGSGCLDTQTLANDSSPTSESNPTPSHTDESESETPSETPDCRQLDLHISNDRSETVTVSVRLIEGRGRYRKGSPTATRAESPTETPTVIFEDESTIPAQASQVYKELPDAEGTHRLEVSVEGGPSETDLIRASKWGGSNAIFVDLHTSSITFKYVTAELHPRCGEPTESPSDIRQ